MNARNQIASTSPAVDGPVKTIDMTPTWGEVGLMYVRLAESKEVKAITQMRSEIARAMAMAQAFKNISETLTGEQKESAGKTIRIELAKQGF